jgi:hypothetical protein
MTVAHRLLALDERRLRGEGDLFHARAWSQQLAERDVNPPASRRPKARSWRKHRSRHRTDARRSPSQRDHRPPRTHRGPETTLTRCTNRRDITSCAPLLSMRRRECAQPINPSWGNRVSQAPTAKGEVGDESIATHNLRWRKLRRGRRSPSVPIATMIRTPLAKHSSAPTVPRRSTRLFTRVRHVSSSPLHEASAISFSKASRVWNVSGFGSSWSKPASLA